MAKISKVEPLVYEALVNNPVTRADDFILILEVMRHFVSEQMPLESVLTHHKELGLPSFASIIRIRRKLQEKHKELINPVIQETREKEQEEFKAYALNN